MKSKLLFLSFLMLLMVTTNYAQSSANISGVAVQGIARDDNNTALINASVRFAFTIYDKSSGDEVHTEDLTITTDEFGVFSHTIAIPTEKYAIFGGKVLWLKIEDDNDVISDEVFKHVPYAISANNGVPTGSIMPFIGSTPPPGWALCNGLPIPNANGEGENLILLQGGNGNTPNLQGMFLRGTGTSPVNNEAGPALMATQQDAFESHTPNVTVDVVPAGRHRHTIEQLPQDSQTGTPNDMAHLNVSAFSDEKWAAITPQGTNALSEAPDHDHPVNVTVTNSGGGTETRPVNFGVNYIIKL
jgi:microcystin-dependent protein